MARPSPITVGTLALAVFVMAAAAYILFRPPDRADVTAAPEPPEETPPSVKVDPPRALPRIVASSPPEVRRQPPPPTPPPPPPLPEVEQPRAPDAAFVLDSGAAGTERVFRIAEHNQQMIKEGDERVFETLNLAETTRAAIRRINEEAAKRARTSLEANPRNPPRTDEAEPERRAAIKNLLGDDASSQFDNTELAAVRHLRLQARAKWTGPLRSGAASPPVVTPAAP